MLASGSPARFQTLIDRLEPRRIISRKPFLTRARREEHELWQAIKAADIAALAEHVAGGTFRLDKVNDAGSIGWRLAGHLRVIT